MIRLNCIIFFIVSVLLQSLFPIDANYGIWEITAPMKYVTEGRSTKLKSGKILVAGNNSYCEIFYAEDEQWILTDSMKSSRTGHVLLTLDDGKALVLGGQGRLHNEIYDELSGTWSDCAFFNLGPRNGGQAVLLNDGTVLYIGGQLEDVVTKTCEIYYPSEDRWMITDSLKYPRELHKATLLQDGTVLVTGGRLDTGLGLLNTAEIYNPLTQKWTEVAPMHEKHARHDAILLPDDNVMILGGDYNNNSTHCEVYDSDNNEWRQVEDIMPGCSINRGGAIILNDSTILIIDNSDWGLYNIKSFTPIGVYFTKNYSLSQEPMIELLNSGFILTMGGWLFKEGAYRPAHEAELFKPSVLNIDDNFRKTAFVFELQQNFPNPFNPVTEIRYRIPITCWVKISIYNILGEEIMILINEKKQSGIHSLSLNASELPSGIYYYQMITPIYRETKKMIKLE
jgi:hypothetical protein